MTELTGGGDGVKDDAFLDLGFVRVDGSAIEGGDDSRAFLISLAGEKPSGRFWKKAHPGQEDEAKNNLESNGESG